MAITFERSQLTKESTSRVNGAITGERAFTIFKQIADTPAPSQTVSYTRAPRIESILCAEAPDHQRHGFERDFKGTGNAALLLTEVPEVVIIAHADEISYLVAGACDGDEIDLLPFCAHRAEGTWPVSILRYSAERHAMLPRGRGTMSSRRASDHLSPYLTLTSGQVSPGDRIIFEHPLTLGEHGLVSGKIDNAAGVTACVLTALALSGLPVLPRAWFVFPDEEEGPPDSNSTFARGARRLIHALDLPAHTLFIVVDGHDTGYDADPAPTALFTEKESRGRGQIVPPDLYAAFKAFVPHLRRKGVTLSENPHYVARSDSPALMERFRNVLLLGYPVKNAHFDRAAPSTSLDAVVSLAKTLTYLLLALRPSTR